MKNNKGEITGLTTYKDGVSVTIAHGKKKKSNNETTKNSMVEDYDSRPTTSVHLPAEQAKECAIGDKVEIKLIKMDHNDDEMSEDEY